MMNWGWDNARSLIGILVIIAIAWAISEKRSAFPLKTVIGAVGLQFVFALLFFGLPKVFGKSSAFGDSGEPNVVIQMLQDATRAGTSFVYGYLGDNASFPVADTGFVAPIFVFQILPLLIVVASLSAMLWHWGILRAITRGFAYIFAKTMGLGGATSLAVSANIFMGMTEAPVLVKPYLKGMSRAEIFILMTTGFATIAGSVLVIYVSFLENVIANPLSQLLTASFMAAPAAVALALVIVPETVATKDRAHEPDFKYSSTMDAFSKGATDGLAIVMNITTMLIAALAILHLGNSILGFLPLNPGGEELSIQRILGWIFSPLMWLIGVPWDEAQKAGSLMGVKTVLTEFIAFANLAEVPDAELSERSRIITAHAICGFANFGSIGILIGGLSIVEPERRETFLSLAWKTLLAGTLATCMSGAVVGFLPEGLFL
ncbi:NupC/NupG family nucleoside CNT transporter [Hirschia litorea]|uniref:NupC/NupG family nucleoside CNT transporter n=1 Tax=Hirschia litorea TaxID=1199156 RepID=A0ABW2II05_9PROT